MRWAPALQVCEDEWRWGVATRPRLSPPHPALPTGNCVVLKPSEISKSTERSWPRCCPDTWTR